MLDLTFPSRPLAVDAVHISERRPQLFNATSFVNVLLKNAQNFVLFVVKMQTILQKKCKRFEKCNKFCKNAKVTSKTCNNVLILF